MILIKIVLYKRIKFYICIMKKHYIYLLMTLFVLCPLAPSPVMAYVSNEGDLVKTANSPAVYLVKSGGRYCFPFERVYRLRYGNDFSKVKIISSEELAGLPLFGNVKLPNDTLVKIATIPRVYVVRDDNFLDWVPSEQDAVNIFGRDWASTVVDVPDTFWGDYQKRGAVVIASPDSDGDGILDSVDSYPAGNSAMIKKSYILEIPEKDGFGQHLLEISIPRDRYDLYVDHMPHNFSGDYSNLRDFVTADDPVIRDIVKYLDSIKPTADYYIYRLISSLVYISDEAGTGSLEYPKYSVETLVDGKGDCEDSAFLLAALLDSMGKDVVLLRYPNHLAVGVAMTDSEIATFNSFISAMNTVISKIKVQMVLTGQTITDLSPSVQKVLSGWALNHALQYYGYNNKKYVYLESTSDNLWLSIGQIPLVYKDVSVYIHPAK